MGPRTELCGTCTNPPLVRSQITLKLSQLQLKVIQVSSFQVLVVFKSFYFVLMKPITLGERSHSTHTYYTKHSLGGNFDKALSCFIGKISQISTINADAYCTITQVIQSQSHCAEVYQTTPETDQNGLVTKQVTNSQLTL